MTAEPKLGTKIFYKIGEVSQIVHLPAYVLRFWETEFSFLKPKKSRGQQRLYVQRDIETILEIKRLVHQEGFTLAGVRRFWALRGQHRGRRLPPRELARRMKGDLQTVLRILESYDA
jgi:DNA-binding transcriptional MerR regulator